MAGANRVIVGLPERLENAEAIIRKQERRLSLIQEALGRLSDEEDREEAINTLYVIEDVVNGVHDL